MHMAVNDVAGERVYQCIMYEIFFLNFWVIILCAVFVRQKLKTYKI